MSVLRRVMAFLACSGAAAAAATLLPLSRLGVVSLRLLDYKQLMNSWHINDVIQFCFDF